MFFCRYVRLEGTRAGILIIDPPVSVLADIRSLAVFANLTLFSLLALFTLNDLRFSAGGEYQYAD